MNSWSDFVLDVKVHESLFCLFIKCTLFFDGLSHCQKLNDLRIITCAMLSRHHQNYLDLIRFLQQETMVSPVRHSNLLILSIID